MSKEPRYDGLALAEALGYKAGRPEDGPSAVERAAIEMRISPPAMPPGARRQTPVYWRWLK